MFEGRIVCGDNGFITQTDVVCFVSPTLRSTNLISVTDILNIEHMLVIFCMSVLHTFHGFEFIHGF